MKIKNIIGLAFLLLGIQYKGLCQAVKPAIEIEGPRAWEKLGSHAISPDGKVVVYDVESEPDPYSWYFKKTKLVVSDVRKMWQKEFPNIAFEGFSKDSRYVKMRDRSNDKAFLLDLNTRDVVKGSNNSYSFREKTAIKQGNQIKIVTTRDSLKNPNPELPEVDVWGYHDANYGNPWRERKTVMEQSFALDTVTGRKIQLTSRYERIHALNGDLAIIYHNEGYESPTEVYWNPKARAKYYLVSLIDGHRDVIAEEGNEGIVNVVFSPDGRFVVFADQTKMKFFSYDIAKKSIHDLSKNEDITVTGYSYTDIKRLNGSILFCEVGSAIVMDDFDLWKLDLSGQRSPENLTQGFGKENGIVFRPQRIKTSESQGDFQKQKGGYILNAFNKVSKEWGFYSLSDLHAQTPVKLTMSQNYFGGDGVEIKRALNSDLYIVIKERADQCPNLYATKDFKNFTQLSSLNSQSSYNWLTSELFTWRSNGKNCDGILYKPENFDERLKYPVVTIVYNQYDDRLNVFPYPTHPEFGDGNYPSVAWLASNGYLVFIPSIEKRPVGKFLEGTCDMLFPGLEKLKSLPFVDSEKIGLEGASWGGGQVNYIITQTNLFAAAISGCGDSEYISKIGYTDQTMRSYSMTGSGFHFGGLLTEVPDSYIKQSPLFHADKVVTPVLLRHGKNDTGIAFYQGLQYFRYLRRLGKKSWMLQYDDDTHGLVPGKNKIDMNTRMAQFFDHYLKDKPAPVWMTKGIDPDMRQVETGLELDDPSVKP